MYLGFPLQDAYFLEKKMFILCLPVLSILFMDKGSDFAVSWLLDELFNNKVFALSSSAKSYSDS